MSLQPAIVVSDAMGRLNLTVDRDQVYDVRVAHDGTIILEPVPPADVSDPQLFWRTYMPYDLMIGDES